MEETPKKRKHRVNPSTYNALLDEYDKVKRGLANAERMLASLAAKASSASTPEPAVKHYTLRFPLDKGTWITIHSNRELLPLHWDRLFALLQMQRLCFAHDDEEVPAGRMMPAAVLACAEA